MEIGHSVPSPFQSPVSLLEWHDSGFPEQPLAFLSFQDIGKPSPDRKAAVVAPVNNGLGIGEGVAPGLKCLKIGEIAAFLIT